ncbi:hypothetical protein EC991_000422 [Linnemannia zychae]|nr:hypothetical protein EC991_000422 [Linnemannia zychae]
MASTGNTMQAMQQKADVVQGAAQDAPHVMATKAQSALDSIKQWSLIQRYVMSPAGYLKQRYIRAPRIVKIGLIGVGAMSAIPLACFAGFMAMVTLGLLIVGGIAFTIVESVFAMFGSIFLLPTLGVSFLVACGVGLVSLVAQVCYVIACGFLGMIWGGGKMREGQRQMREAGQRAEQGGRRITN